MIVIEIVAIVRKRFPATDYLLLQTVRYLPAG